MTVSQINAINPQIQNFTAKNINNAVNPHADKCFYSNSNVSTDIVDFSQASANTSCKDGCDDGKISFGQKAKNFGKGCLRLITGQFTDKNGKFSLKRTLCTLGVIAAGAVLTVATAGTAAAGFLACAGVVAGVVGGGAGVVKGAIKASKANTDAEAEEAWQNIGTGTAAIGVAIAGSKGAMKVANKGVKYDGNCLQATKDCFKFVGKSTKSGATGVMNSVKAGTFRVDAANYVKDAKAVAMNNIDNTVKTSKVYNVRKLNKEIDKLRNADGTVKAGCKERLVSLERQKEILKSRKYKISKVYSAEEANEMLKSKGCSQAPYLEGTDVYELKMRKEAVFARTYDAVNSKQQGGWVMHPEDLTGLTPAQIKNNYALPQEPKYITDVIFQKGDVLRSGSVNPLEGWGKGGAVQFDLMSDANKGFIGKFVNERTL